MAAVNSQDVVFVKINLIALLQFMEPSLVQRIVHDTPQPLPVTLRDLHPKVFAPAS